MRWSKEDRSSDLEDRRGESSGTGGGGGFRLPGGKLSLGGLIIAVVIALIAQKFGGGGGGAGQAVNDALNGGAGGGGASSSGAPRATQPAGADPDADTVEFMNFLVKDLERTWEAQFQKMGKRWRSPKLVLFTEATTTGGCGPADADVGPFYCPADEKVYIDLGFYRELATRFAAPGDFAEAYVFAHEVGHHVQMLLGYTDRADAVTSRDPSRKNDISIRLELQADCLAGVWGHYGAERKLLDPGDLEEGLAAAQAVGDDRLQKQATGRVQPETWTHGSSAQRATWFRRGFDKGDVADCDTLSANPL